MRRTAFVILLGLCLSAGAQELTELLVQAAATAPAGDAQSYTAARAEILVRADLAGLDAIAADQALSWQARTVAAACAARLRDPALATSVEAPRGLDRETYLRFRKPKPICEPDLVRCGAVAVPLFIERFVWTAEQYPFTEGPEGVREREVYRRALLAATGRLGGPEAGAFLETVLRDVEQPVELRRAAALSFGQAAGAAAHASLVELLDASVPALVREACARGLGHVPTRDAAAALTARVTGEEDETVRQSLVYALGNLGSAWAWDSRANADAAAASLALQVRADCAAGLLAALRAHPEDASTLGTAFALVAWPASLQALELQYGSDAAVDAAIATIQPMLEAALARR